MTSIRQAAVAGQFYPGNARELNAAVEHFLARASAPEGPVPKAIIAPHAGYIYSGAVAANAYARLRPAARQIRKVILLGPCHRVPLKGLALSSADAFATPLGDVPIDREATARLKELPQVKIFDATHLQEHSLEVHLPFLQVILDDFTLVPLVVGEASPDEVAEVLEAVWGGPETLVVISSDLSHHEDYETARRMDAATCRAIESLDPVGIGSHDACGRIPVGGLLRLAKTRNLEVTTLDLRNSGDTAGPKDRVVGYGSWAFFEPQSESHRPESHRPEGHRPETHHEDDDDDAAASDPAQDDFAARTRRLMEKHGETLLHLAAASIEFGLRQGQTLPVDILDYAPDLREDGASFVTLKIRGKLRGCIGTSIATHPLVRDVSDHAYAAAFQDPRFPPLTTREIPGLSLSVSVLSAPAPMTIADEQDLIAQLRPHIDGLIIRDAGRQALFLPAVWETLGEPKIFLAHLKAKSGMAVNHWSAGFRAWRFVAEEISSDQLADPAAVWSNAAD